MELLGHVLASAALFMGLAGVAWAIGWGVDLLDHTHKFNPAVLELLHGVELVILYLDIGLSGMVLLVGAAKFLRKLTGK